MELDELDVSQPGPRAGGQGQAVAGEPGRVGGGRERLAEPAGGEHDSPRRHRARLQGPAVAADQPGQQPADAARSSASASRATTTALRA